LGGLDPLKICGRVRVCFDPLPINRQGHRPWEVLTPENMWEGSDYVLTPYTYKQAGAKNLGVGVCLDALEICGRVRVCFDPLYL